MGKAPELVQADAQRMQPVLERWVRASPWQRDNFGLWLLAAGTIGATIVTASLVALTRSFADATPYVGFYVLHIAAGIALIVLGMPARIELLGDTLVEHRLGRRPLVRQLSRARYYLHARWPVTPH